LREIQTIAALYPGRSELLKDPTKAELRRRVAGADFVHLSVHGSFKIEEPLLSYLKLRPEGEDDGKLTAAEMFGLPLDHARLVVLSACETGETIVTNANEMLGMIRGLLYAGADALVLSWWRVDAQSTAEWMEAFYQALRTEPAAEAARQALMTVKAKPEYRHPYHWATFQLVGQ
jgi:CHAT domain-containing protein